MRADAVITTGPAAFAASQQALGAMLFMKQLSYAKPVNAFGDPAGCLVGGFTQKTLKDLYFRQMRCAQKLVLRTKPMSCYLPLEVIISSNVPISS
jgi:hypothetical protein